MHDLRIQNECQRSCNRMRKISRPTAAEALYLVKNSIKEQGWIGNQARVTIIKNQNRAFSHLTRAAAFVLMPY